MARPADDDLVAAVCRMALANDPRLSHVDLIDRAGYLDRRGDVTVEQLRGYLSTNLVLIDAWQRWVDDNRGHPAWYFTSRSPGSHEVGYIPRNGPPIILLRTEDRVEACAAYLMREIELLADIAELWRRPWRPAKRLLARAIRGARVR